MSYLLTWLLAILVTLYLWFVPVEFETGGDPSDVATEPTVAFIGYGTPEP